MGGSSTLVTHFVATRDDLFTTIVEETLATYDEELAELEAGAGPSERLWIFLRFLLPLSSEDSLGEAGRIAMIPRRGDHAGVDHFFDEVENKTRALLRSHLEECVPPEDVDLAVSYLRASVNGVVLSSIEHPDRWPPAEQLAVLRLALRALGIEAPVEVA